MGRAASICRNTEVSIGCQETCGLCRCHGGSLASGRAGSKRRSKKDRVTSLARSIAVTQAKGLSKTVSRRSLVVACERGIQRSKKDRVTSFTRSIAGTQVKGLFLGVAGITTRHKAPCAEERAVHAVSTERIKE